jgi:hypothetical protein
VLKLFERMPFGKFKGQKLTEINQEYLQWCLDNINFTGNTLKTSIEYELLNREAMRMDLAANYSQNHPEDDEDIPF